MKEKFESKQTEERAEAHDGMQQPRDRKQNGRNTIVLLALMGILIVAGILIYPKLAKDYVPEEAGKTAAPAASAQPTATVSASPTPAAELAPDFTVTNASGEEVSLSDNFGKPIIVNFWATWCGPCREELPYFNAASQKYGDSVTFMMVNLTDGSRDTEEGVKAFIEKQGYAFPVYFDLELMAADAYGIRSIPTTVIIDESGAIVDMHLGTLSEAQVQSMVDMLLGK